jgi:predicted RNA polymerase sigma factor
MTDIDEVITRAHREEWARVVATLARRLGDLDIAEEMAADAFATAVERWPVDGVPRNPGAWLTTTAHRKAIDRLRREARREEKTREALMLSDTAEPLGAIDDDRLRLVFTCCHPALAMEARVALTLRMVHCAPRSPTRSWSRRPPWATGSPARRRRSRRQRSPMACRYVRTSRPGLRACSPSST